MLLLFMSVPETNTALEAQTRGERFKNGALGLGLLAVGATMAVKNGLELPEFIDLANMHIDSDAPGALGTFFGAGSGLASMSLGLRRLARNNPQDQA